MMLGFGTIVVKDKDNVAFGVLEAYCHAKPFWWNWFWGWRRTYADGDMIYKVKFEDVEFLNDTIEIIKMGLACNGLRNIRPEKEEKKECDSK